MIDEFYQFFVVHTNGTRECHQRVTLESETKENTKYVGAHPRPLDIIIFAFSTAL